MPAFRKRIGVRNVSTRWGRAASRPLPRATRRTVPLRVDSGDAARVLAAHAPKPRAHAPDPRILSLPPRPHRRPLHSVRRSRVASARARLATGWYDRPHVRWCIADLVLRELER